MRAEAWFVTIAPLPVIAGLLVIGASRGEWTAVKIAGLIFTIVGAILLTAARLNLGDSFSITPQAKKLVTRGVYSRIRHPVYVFSAMLIAGLGLYFDLLWVLVFVAVILIIQLVRARKEEQVLERAFGEEYRAYRRSTWF
jgi:protein-S-isoprenylcysteine O-methyltransferase Ste14